MECTFSLKDPRPGKPALIIFYTRLPGGERYRKGIDKKVLPENWDTQHRRAKGIDRESRDLNSFLDHIQDAFDTLVRERTREKRFVTYYDLDDILSLFVQKKRRDTEMFDDMRAFISLMRSGEIMTPGKKKKRYDDSTLRIYELTVDMLEKFYADKKLVASWSTVTIETYHQFLNWCFEKNFSNNYIGVRIKHWKRLAGIAKAKKLHNNDVFESEEFYTLKEDTPDIYLTNEKIDKIFEQSVTKPGHEIAVAWFVLNCDLGLRISDLQRVTEKDFAGDTFKLINQKTEEYIELPISSRVRKIIQKWHGLPPRISEQKFNQYIKIVAKAAGLKDKFVYTITKGGKKQLFEYEEWQMISSHTCRRTFITRLLKMGIPVHRVKKLAGIKKDETLERYYKETPREIAHAVKGQAIFK